MINEIEKLSFPFIIKTKVFLAVARKKFPNLAPFETLRSKARQKLLVAMGKSWTLKSKHLEGKAVDWVFLDKKGNPTWKGDYKYLHYIGFMCGMTPIYNTKGQLIESCHLQDDGKSIEKVLETNSNRWHSSKDVNEKALLNIINTEFRKYI